MAHPLIDGDARLTQVAVAYVVVLGLAVGAVGVAPVVGALLTASALIGAAIARLPRRAAVLGVAPLILAAGVPWPVPAVAAVPASRVVGGPMLTTATARRADQPARSVAEVAVLVAVCVPAAAALANHSLGDERPVLPLGRPPVLAVAAVVILAAVLNATAEELFWRGAAMRLLADSGHRAPTTIGLQAVSFGAAHAAGLPGGVPGAVGALGLGLFLGVLRFRQPAIRGCVVVHTAVDVALPGVLADRVVWVG